MHEETIDRVLARMAKLGMRRSDLVRASGLAPSTVTMLLKNQRGKKLSLETARKLAKGLKVRVNFFYPAISHAGKQESVHDA